MFGLFTIVPTHKAFNQNSNKVTEFFLKNQKNTHYDVSNKFKQFQLANVKNNLCTIYLMYCLVYPYQSFLLLLFLLLINIFVLLNTYFGFEDKVAVFLLFGDDLYIFSISRFSRQHKLHVTFFFWFCFSSTQYFRFNLQSLFASFSSHIYFDKSILCLLIYF